MRLVLTTLAALTIGTAVPEVASAKNCPPGLAKKAVPCVPPGQAKKQQRQTDPVLHTRYRPGDVIGDYIVIRDPNRYGLNPAHSYYRSGNYVYRVNEDTRKVINLIGAVADILN